MSTETKINNADVKKEVIELLNQAKIKLSKIDETDILKYELKYMAEVIDEVIDGNSEYMMDQYYNSNC